MSEVMKHKKDLEILKMMEDEVIIVYSFSVVVPRLFGGKRTTKSDISYLPTYGKWRENIYRQVWFMTWRRCWIPCTVTSS